MAVGPMITATSIRLRERAFDCRLAEGGYTGDGELFDQAFKMIEQQAAEIEHHQAAKRRALKIADERAIEANGVRQENERIRAALKPFVRYYEDIRFNLRKQPRPDAAAVEERGERNACITWAEFYALNDACNFEQTLREKGTT